MNSVKMFISHSKIVFILYFLVHCLNNVIGNDYNENCELVEQNDCQFYKNKGNSQCVYTGITNLKGGSLYAKPMSETGTNKVEVIHSYDELLIVRKTKTELSKTISNNGSTWKFIMARTKLVEIVTSIEIYDSGSLLSNFDLGSKSEIKIVFHGNIAFSFKDPCLLSLSFTSNGSHETEPQQITPPSNNHKYQPTTSPEIDPGKPSNHATIAGESQAQASTSGQDRQTKETSHLCVVLCIALQCLFVHRPFGTAEPNKIV